MSLRGGSRAGRAFMALTMVAVASCGGGDDQTRAETGATTGPAAPSSEAAELVTLPVVEPVPWSIGAVRPEGALVISHRVPGYGELDGAGVVTPDGVVVEIQVPGGLRGVEPVATASGFAVFGYECTVGEDNPGGDCVSVTGVVAFYRSSGALSAVRKTPPKQGVGAMSVAESHGDEVVLTGGDVWLVTPTSVEVLTGPEGSAICGIDDQGIFAAEPISTDPAAPEDTLTGFDVVVRRADGMWDSLEEVAPVPDGAPWPFCTSSGIVVSDRFFDGERLVALDLEAQPVELGRRQTVGVADDGTILQRVIATPGQPPIDRETGLPTWIGLSRDGTMALRAIHDGWEFVDVTS